MCLIFIAHRQHPDYPLVIAANRDEFYERPTRPMHWQDNGRLLAGKDLSAGGTWLGLSKTGRFAAVTNYREPQASQPAASSRGHIPLDFLRSDLSITDFAEQLRQHQNDYAGFNLVFGSLKPPYLLYHFSNRNDVLAPLDNGIFGLSNALLDSPWPKIDQARPQIDRLMQKPPKTEDWFEIMADKHMASMEELPETGIGSEAEKLMSPRFIHTPGYGTRSTSLIMIGRSQPIVVHERNYNHHAEVESTQRFELTIDV